MGGRVRIAHDGGRFPLGRMARFSTRKLPGRLRTKSRQPRDWPPYHTCSVRPWKGAAVSLRRVTGLFGISNGLGWSPDGTAFYHIDLMQRRVDRYAFDPASGRLGARETALDLSAERGLPDGMTVDADGRLWIAFWGGGAIKCVEPDDLSPRKIVELPCAQVASCEFGGTDFSDLCITTARRGPDGAQRASQPEAGAVFVCRPAAVGQRAHHVGDSTRPNSFSERGHPTVLRVSRTRPLTVNFIMGVVAIPRAFGQVAAIEPEEGRVVLVGAKGARVACTVEHGFLRTAENG
ncbi:MAG TPA: SMP-30/gluconolactonase/LRE family protein [Opitutaceae bacterium]|nr:SMP-30/gluconolactonase/LRE family protein [Opitutaceae bacterium]